MLSWEAQSCVVKCDPKGVHCHDQQGLALISAMLLLISLSSIFSLYHCLLPSLYIFCEEAVMLLL